MLLNVGVNNEPPGSSLKYKNMWYDIPTPTHGTRNVNFKLYMYHVNNLRKNDTNGGNSL